MGKAYQPPLGIDLLQPPQVESAEAHILLDIAKHRLNIHRAFFAQSDAALRCEILPCLAAIFEQLKTNLDTSLGRDLP
jgi:hypothetical protein